MGEGGAAILEALDKSGSIAEAARQLRMSYKYVWSYLKRMEKALGQPVIEARRGGSRGGGAVLSEVGKELLKEYRRRERWLKEALRDEEAWEAVNVKISARNRLRGVVKHVEVDGVAAKVQIEVQGPVTITSLISKEAVEELELREGDVVEAVVKATEVLVAKPSLPRLSHARGELRQP